ncbi:2-C-methyl-D-erythritol 2,4-cyclodiphosphate synthase [Litorimonas taeanensis]|uniref:Bifunctional enzyme IspD/IspF n=1 Tax=Litorimonas taeanensis TaxID=568099 RepID=A0A420WJ66_9PROT|nr:bifunctional 2-C-methyl-D-erythritol 4-phosphate cytidylyltransferase/2-C-methyl-D-erythritol 2,4-cyclodiphosphate synthase [Litorimonas taeanensis]RKQ71071.1 2-C-methyl-D-erythritol 2,4-cyclodiphosphate synthase [Litorimonas taeanensis]
MLRSALILVAAGKGERVGGNIPKQFQPLSGKPLIEHTISNLKKSFDFNVISIVVAKNCRFIGDLSEKPSSALKIVTGGSTRTESVRCGLNSLKGKDIDHVYIHDAARPFVTEALIKALGQALETHSAAVPALKIVDACKSPEGAAVNRDEILRVQTPQAFHYDKILSAFDEYAANDAFADDIAVAHKAGLSLTFTQGDERNFKLTYAEDFAKAEAMLQTPTYIATGSGFDVHQFEDGGTLWLCGVPIECGYSLKGHSDADAGLHALTDAILGALAFGDIGDHFPPSDEKWKGASSDKFLLFALEEMQKRRGKLQHVDVTLICEKPKIKPHREAMRSRISELCQLPMHRVSLKATTTEKLGFTGRGEGLAAQASATIVLPE